MKWYRSLSASAVPIIISHLFPSMPIIISSGKVASSRRGPLPGLSRSQETWGDPGSQAVCRGEQALLLSTRPAMLTPQPAPKEFQVQRAKKCKIGFLSSFSLHFAPLWEKTIPLPGVKKPDKELKVSLILWKSGMSLASSSESGRAFLSFSRRKGDGKMSHLQIFN